MPVIAWLALQVHAAEVVWLVPPTPEAQALVEAIEPTARPIELNELRTAATAWSPEDEERYARLERALADVRAYETRLDGELVILQDLRDPIASISAVPDDEHRQALFAALAYQGFAVNRFFDTELGVADKAAPYRTEIEGHWVETPWLDAVALEPERDVTPYEIAEAPQRVAYGQRRQQLSRVLPASLIPRDLPDGSRLFLDGRETGLAAAGNLRVRPGRHLVHLLLPGDRIAARWDVRLGPGEERSLEVELSDAIWTSWLDAVRSEAPVVPTPAEVLPHLEALGGTVWLVTAAGAGGVEVAVVTASGLERRGLERVGTRPSRGDEGGPFSLAGALQVGWLSSGNFYTDDPVEQDASFGTVNAGQVGLSLGGDATLGWLRAGVGLDVLASFGSAHQARYGGNKTPFRIYPHVAVGIPWVQVTAGFALPHHPAVGARGSLPLPWMDGLELRGNALVGFGGNVPRGDGEWERLPLYAAGVGVGYRLPL